MTRELKGKRKTDVEKASETRIELDAKIRSMTHAQTGVYLNIGLLHPRDPEKGMTRLISIDGEDHPPIEVDLRNFDIAWNYLKVPAGVPNTIHAAIHHFRRRHLLALRIGHLENISQYVFLRPARLLPCMAMYRHEGNLNRVDMPLKCLGVPKGGYPVAGMPGLLRDEPSLGECLVKCIRGEQ